MLIMALIFVIDEDLYERLKTSISNLESTAGLIETEKLSSEYLKVSFIDVGQADSILIEKNNKYMLIDAANNEDEEKLIRYLKNIGIEKFEYVIGTHAHEDHIGSMDAVIDNFDIRTFYMPDVTTTTKTFEDVLDSLAKKNIYFDTPKIGTNFSFDDTNVEVIYVGNDSNDLNSTSIILRLSYKDVSFLFTGDTTGEVEKIILNKNIESTVLKVAHHGSKYSSTATFLKKVNPKYAVISVGKYNSYNHPDNVVLEKLNKMGVTTKRTDKDGTIYFTTDGKDIKINSTFTDTNQE